jgi:hypothetical protein
MTTLITVYHNGLIITNVIGSYEFVRIKKEIFLFSEFPPHGNFIGESASRLSVWVLKD